MLSWWLLISYHGRKPCTYFWNSLLAACGSQGGLCPPNIRDPCSDCWSLLLIVEVQTQRQATIVAPLTSTAAISCSWSGFRGIGKASAHVFFFSPFTFPFWQPATEGFDSFPEFSGVFKIFVFCLVWIYFCFFDCYELAVCQELAWCINWRSSWVFSKPMPFPGQVQWVHCGGRIWFP